MNIERRGGTPHVKHLVAPLLVIVTLTVLVAPSRAADGPRAGTVPSWYNPLPGTQAPPAKASEEAKTAKVVSGRALEAALRGNALRRSGAGVTAPDLTENFATNGTWMLVGTRVPGDGVYTVHEDRFCVEFPRAKITCRQLLFSIGGKYFTRSPGDKAHAEPVEITYSK